MMKMREWNGKRTLDVWTLVVGMGFCGLAMEATAASTSGVMQSPSAPTATMPTSGTCSFEINMILAGGVSVVDYNQASKVTLGTTVGPFTLGLLGQFTFTGTTGTFSVTEVDRSYTSASPSPPTTVDTSLNTSGTFAVSAQTGTAVVPGAAQIQLTMTAQNGVAMTAKPGPTLLVMPVNGGNTLLVQDQTSGSGGGVCQF